MPDQYRQLLPLQEKKKTKNTKAQLIVTRSWKQKFTVSSPQQKNLFLQKFKGWVNFPLQTPAKTSCFKSLNHVLLDGWFSVNQSVSTATRASVRLLSLLCTHRTSASVLFTWQVSLPQRHFGMGGCTHSTTSHISGIRNLEEHSPESLWQQSTQTWREEEVQPALHPSTPPKHKVKEWPSK